MKYDLGKYHVTLLREQLEVVRRASATIRDPAASEADFTSASSSLLLVEAELAAALKVAEEENRLTPDRLKSELIWLTATAVREGDVTAEQVLEALALSMAATTGNYGVSLDLVLDWLTWHFGGAHRERLAEAIRAGTSARRS